MDTLLLRNPLRGLLTNSLIEKLKSSSAVIRYQAAQAIGEQGLKASLATKELLRALEDENPKVRYFAAQSIGNVASSPNQAVDALILYIRNELDNSQSTSARAAFRSLLKLGNRFPEEVIPHLIAELENPAISTKGTKGGTRGAVSTEAKKDLKACEGLTECLLSIGKQYEETLGKYLDRASRSKRSTLKKNAELLQQHIEQVGRSQTTTSA